MAGFFSKIKSSFKGDKNFDDEEMVEHGDEYVELDTSKGSEGGHVDLPVIADDPIDFKLQSFLIKKKIYKDAEDIVSGRGIVNIYNFLLTQKIRHNTKIQAMIKRAPDINKPSLITKYALEDKDALCIRVLELFIKYYARISRSLSLS